MKKQSYPFFYILLLTCFIVSCETQDAETPENKPTPNDKHGSYEVMDYGPVLSGSIHLDWPEEGLVRKGLAIRLDHETAMIFDTDRVSFAAGSVGGWLDISKTDYMNYKGSEIARLEGRQVFGSAGLAGWAKEGSFDGPREEGMGPLPDPWAHYNGYYRYGDQVVLSYRAGGTDVLEVPGAIRHDQSRAFLRTLQVGPSERPLKALIAAQRRDWTVSSRGDREVLFDTGAGEGDTTFAVGLIHGPEGARLAVEEGRVSLQLPPSGAARTVQVMISEMKSPELFGELRNTAAQAGLPDFSGMTRGGPAVWEQSITLEGTLSDEESGYVKDRIPIPFNNPWGSWMRLSGLDFFEDGTRAAVSTWNGDVWIVSGIEESLDEVRWKRFASGLFYPMGVAVADGQIFVTERGQLTRLHDLNGDGEADYYENFNNDGVVHPMAHTLGLEVDSGGNFYFFKNGNRAPGEVPRHGALMQVSPDGAKREVFARGFRGSNALGIGPDDMILSADQQGNWVPVERVDLVKHGKFYGYRPHGGEHLEVGQFEPPVAWIPYDVNNSTGSLTYTDHSRWGPLSGQWLLGSYGQASVQMVLTQELVEGKLQGAVIKLPFESKSGLIRGSVNPGDGQLYLIGLRGWTTLGKEDGSFERIRYTGEKVYVPTGFRIKPDGIELDFTEPLDPKSARNENNYTVQRWEYIYSEQYGSPEISLEDPEKEGRDSVAIQSVTLSNEGKTVSLEIPDMRSVMQMKIEYNLLFEDGHSVLNAIYPTVNWLSKEDIDEIPKWQQRIIAGYRESDNGDETIEKEKADDPFVSKKFQRGKEIFQHNCASCHVSGGVAPSLEKSEWAASDPDAIIRILLNGKRGDSGVMTPFEWMADEEIASVISYIRQKWHEKEPISAPEVEQIREDTRERTELWTEEELKNFIQ